MEVYYVARINLLYVAEFAAGHQNKDTNRYLLKPFE